MNKQKQQLPDFLEKYFWDIDPRQLDIYKDYFIILERLLNYGDDRTLKWVLNNYNYQQIKEVTKKSRRLSPKTANFWQKHLGLRREEIKCFQKSYQKTEKIF